MPPMPDEKRPGLEERIRVEVDRAVAPYVGVAPPFMIAKMRELVERYWRENPTAARVLQLDAEKQRVRSGDRRREAEDVEQAGDEAPRGEAGEAAGGKKA